MMSKEMRSETAYLIFVVTNLFVSYVNVCGRYYEENPTSSLIDFSSHRLINF